MATASRLLSMTLIRQVEARLYWSPFQELNCWDTTHPSTCRRGTTANLSTARLYFKRTHGPTFLAQQTDSPTVSTARLEKMCLRCSTTAAACTTFFIRS